MPIKEPIKYCLWCRVECDVKFCSRSCSAKYNNRERNTSGWRHSEKTKQLIRDKALENPVGWAKNPSITGKERDESKWIISRCDECGIDFEHHINRKKGIKKYCSKSCYAKNSGGFQPNSTRKTRSMYNGFQMDSGTERKFAELLDEHDIKWIKNSTKYFEFIDNKGKVRKYYPDFYLPYYDKWIEIKSKYYLRENDNLRWSSVPNHEVIWDYDLKLPNLAQVRIW